MGPLELILVSLAAIAGTFAATSATIACCRLAARRERDRQIFRAYLEDPRQLEMWLTNGAIELLENTVAKAADPLPEADQAPPSIASAFPRLAIHHNALMET
jgi:hypothetical protein